MKIASVVGARPQFIKIAPLLKAIAKHKEKGNHPPIHHILIHTGQHYDYQMSKIFFDELEIPEPDYNLEVGSGSHGWQTGQMLRRVEEVLLKEKPQWALVYGDTNSTLAGALGAVKLHIPVAHVEAGLRSFNRQMPEEINRVLTDRISTILFCPTETAVKNLQKEGFTNIFHSGKLVKKISGNEKIRFRPEDPLVINAGDIMYDLLILSLPLAERKNEILRQLQLEPKKYFLITVHRAENADDSGKMKSIMQALLELNKTVVFPVHPRTKSTLQKLGIFKTTVISQSASPSPSYWDYKNIRFLEPLSYLEMLNLEKNAQLILTDSGGVQKEAFWLGIPTITLREETEWVETVERGWNRLTGTDSERIIETVESLETGKSTKPKRKNLHIYGDGDTAEKIVNILWKTELIQ